MMTPPEAAVEPRPAFWIWFQRAVLVLFLVFAYTYVFTVQPRFGPDEPRHFNFVRRLVEKGQLPLRTPEGEVDEAHTLHPPLYYALVSPLYMATRHLDEKTSYLAIKCASPVLLLGSLVLFLRLLRRAFPDRPFAAASALAVVALLPEFQLEAAVMNNDGLAVLLGALWFWLLVRLCDEPPSARWAAAAGLIMALFVNTKATGWTLSPLWLLALLLRARRVPAAKGHWLRDLVLGYGVLLALGTWWYVRNYQLYGQLVPLDFAGGKLNPYDLRTGQPLSPVQVYTSGYVVTWGWRATEGLFQSFWGQIDWFREEYRPALFGSLLVLTLAAAVGGVLRLLPWLRAVIARRRGGSSADVRPPGVGPVVLPAAGFVLNWLHTWFIATFLHIGFYQGGRYLMPSVFGAGALLGAGWDALVPSRWRRAAAVLLLLGLVGLNVLCLVELITALNPKYVF